MNDHELHQAASQYVFEQRVSYVEAVQAVLSREQHQAQAAAAASDAAASRPSDAALDAQARAYAEKNGIRYAEALREVMARKGVETLLDRVRASAAPNSDQAIDAKARAFALQNRVSYAEALDCVTGMSFACFAESSSAAPGGSAADMLAGQRIDIFEAGTHVSMQGERLTFSQADIEAIAASYDPARREAPLTVGHPEHDKPAYGWVRRLHVAPGGRLQMEVHQVDPAFAEMVSAARFKKRSASFYPPNAHGNPTPGRWYLRHVAFLGAQQPALAGLADLQLMRV